jgi:outer membrane receptor for ferrienterochelin and colicin
MINDPIERVFKPTANSGGQITTFKNSEQAVIFGAEIEMLFQLSRINEVLSNFSIGFNTSLMSTDVKIDLKKQGNELENNSNRNLQGASNWLINTDLKYDFVLNTEWKNSMTLVYNVYGDRIFAVGSSGIDHIYEKSFSKLDFVWSSTLSKNIDLKFAVDNLLNPSYKKELGPNSTLAITEDSLILREFKKGVGFSVNIGYTF